MLVIFIRTIVLYVLVLIVMRCMGKREIGQLQPFELAISIMIADVASTPMANVGIPIGNRNSSYSWTFGNAFFNFSYKHEKCKRKSFYLWKTIYFNLQGKN